MTGLATAGHYPTGCARAWPRSRSASRPKRATELHLRPNDFRLQVGLEAGFAGLVAPTGLLVPAEGHRVVELHLAVQPHGSGLEALGDSVCPAQVRGPGGGGQAVGAVVGQRDRFVLVVERYDRDHRSEDLLLEQPARGGDVGEHGRVDEVALAVEPVPTGDDLDAVRLALVEVTHDAGELLLADQRTDQAALVLGAALRQPVREVRQALHELLVDAALDEDARPA